ncbi:unnamed protein product [Microthlaspi erraticum]|uniref:NB-ARC domain-containing protein n=1 Tax=Microthlaspi erraticum TaxID=1685480 RepID=A0A6D2HY02_9BRAS|nr:unnamed protein product [Microthlaspi erraticum]
MRLTGWLCGAYKGLENRIYRKLQSFKTCLVIIDDVKSIDLDVLGIPWRNNGNGVRVKILITARDRAVCRRLAVDHVVKLDFLSCDDAWKYFSKLVGETATTEPMAKQLCMQLGGYQFAIKAMGRIIGHWKYGLKDMKFPDRLSGNYCLLNFFLNILNYCSSTVMVLS